MRDVMQVRLPNGRVVTYDGPVARREIAAGRAVPVVPEPVVTEAAVALPPETAAKPKPMGRRRS
jgi:hypothetical protein